MAVPGRARPSPSAPRSVAPGSPRGSARTARHRRARGSFWGGPVCGSTAPERAPVPGCAAQSPGGCAAVPPISRVSPRKNPDGREASSPRQAGCAAAAAGGLRWAAAWDVGTPLPAAGRDSACCPHCLSRFPAAGMSRERRSPGLTALLVPASVSLCALWASHSIRHGPGMPGGRRAAPSCPRHCAGCCGGGGGLGVVGG